MRRRRRGRRARLGRERTSAGRSGERHPLVLGASVTGLGLVAIGVGAVAGQVTSTSRGANTLGSVVFGVFYMRRMIGDLGDGRRTWVSPLSWGQQMQPWGANRWWPFVLLVELTGVLLAVTARLQARRDLGAGLMPDRPGPAGVPARYATSLGLALRLQRGSIIGWSATIVLCALVFGSVIQAMTNLLHDAGAKATAVIGVTTVDALLSLLVLLIALVTTVFALQSATSLRADEASGIIEPHLASALSRTRWAVQRLLIPAVGRAVLLLVEGASMDAGYGSLVGDPGVFLPVGACRPGVLAGHHGAGRRRGGAVRLAAPARLAAQPAAILGDTPPAARVADMDTAGHVGARRRRTHLDRPRPLRPARHTTGVITSAKPRQLIRSEFLSSEQGEAPPGMVPRAPLFWFSDPVRPGQLRTCLGAVRRLDGGTVSGA